MLESVEKIKEKNKALISSESNVIRHAAVFHKVRLIFIDAVEKHFAQTEVNILTSLLRRLIGHQLDRSR